jgi:hypothetical protein
VRNYLPDPVPRYLPGPKGVGGVRFTAASAARYLREFYGFELTAAQLRALDTLGAGRRDIGPLSVPRGWGAQQFLDYWARWASPYERALAARARRFLKRP